MITQPKQSRKPGEDHPWTSEQQRHNAYQGFIHFYNHHRPHGSLHWANPISIIEDNLPKEHS